MNILSGLYATYTYAYLAVLLVVLNRVLTHIVLTSCISYKLILIMCQFSMGCSLTLW